MGIAEQTWSRTPPCPGTPSTSTKDRDGRRADERQSIRHEFPPIETFVDYFLIILSCLGKPTIYQPEFSEWADGCDITPHEESTPLVQGDSGEHRASFS